MISEIMRMGDLQVRPPTSDSFDKVLAIKNIGSRTVICKMPSSLAGVLLDLDEQTMLNALVNDGITSVHSFFNTEKQMRCNVRLYFKRLSRLVQTSTTSVTQFAHTSLIRVNGNFDTLNPSVSQKSSVENVEFTMTQPSNAPPNALTANPLSRRL